MLKFFLKDLMRITRLILVGPGSVDKFFERMEDSFISFSSFRMKSVLFLFLPSELGVFLFLFHPSE